MVKLAKLKFVKPSKRKITSKKLLFTDKAGNKLFKENKQLAIRNRQGRIITKGDTLKFLKREKIRFIQKKRRK